MHADGGDVAHAARDHRGGARRTRPKAALAFVLLLGSALFGCAVEKLRNVDLTVRDDAPEPPIIGAMGGDPPVVTASDWTARRAPLLREAFQSAVYGRWPLGVHATTSAKAVLDADAFGVGARVEQWPVALSGAGDGGGFSMIVVTPRTSDRAAPMLLMENFCGNAVALPHIPGVDGPRRGAPPECRNSIVRFFVPAIFGDAIVEPPVARVLSAGWGVAMFYGGDIAPDDAKAAEPLLAELTPGGFPQRERTGAVAAWAFGFSKAVDVLSRDPRFDATRFVVWGHSRNGKAALLAAAMDSRIAGAIALQPGKGGAALARDRGGESVSAIVKAFPHWFAPAFADYAGTEYRLPVDQHQLIALTAPRPVLVGGARRDGWADPVSAFRAARAASEVYALLGAAPFTQTDLSTPDFRHPIVTYMRPGLHGVRSEDWTVALEFLEKRLPHRTPEAAKVGGSGGGGLAR